MPENVVQATHRSVEILRLIGIDTPENRDIAYDYIQERGYRVRVYGPQVDNMTMHPTGNYEIIAEKVISESIVNITL